MAYSTSNPPALLVPAPMDNQIGPQLWAYKSTDAIATVLGSGYFSNGYALGMDVGDLVFVYDTTNTRVSITVVVSSSSSTGAASLGTTATTTSAAGALTLS